VATHQLLILWQHVSSYATAVPNLDMATRQLAMS
jgi:hypothetical protein